MDGNTYVKTSLSLQQDGDKYTVGRTDIGTFIRIPSEGAKIITYLNYGTSISSLSKNTNISQEICLDFISELQKLKLIYKIDDKEIYQLESQTTMNSLYFFSCIVFSKIFVISTLSIFFILILVSSQKSSGIFSGNTLLTTYPGMNIICISVLSLILMMNHEFGHYLGALSQKVKTKFNINSRFIFIVMEAEMNNIWSLPKHKRYIPLLGGPFFDVLALILTYTLYITGTIHIKFISSIISLISLQFLFQFIILFRTDFYYLIINYFNLPSLHEKAIKCIKERDIIYQNKIIKMYISYIFIFSTLFLIYFIRVIVKNLSEEINMLLGNISTFKLDLVYLDSLLGLILLFSLFIAFLYIIYKNKFKKEKV